MFNCLPGAMLDMGHTHQCEKGFSCSRVHSQNNPRMTASHRLFNPAPPGGQARYGLRGWQGWARPFRERMATAPPLARAKEKGPRSASDLPLFGIKPQLLP